MKKFLTTVIPLAGLTLTCCGDNDDQPGIQSSSTITIDSQPFSGPVAAKTFTQEEVIEGHRRRFFQLTKNSAERISIYIDTPAAKPNVNGTYIFHIEETLGNMFGGGMYTIGDTAYGGAGGFVHVTDKGNSVYRLEFEDVEFVKVFTSETKVINGTYEGTFTEQIF